MSPRESLLMLLCGLAAIGCNRRSEPKKENEKEKAAEESATCGDQPMDPAVEKCFETAVCELSSRRVGVANIYERDFVDSRGQRGKRLSAQLVIFDPTSREERTEKLFAGTAVDIGSDHYCLVQVNGGTRDELEWASLQKILR